MAYLINMIMVVEIKISSIGSDITTFGLQLVVLFREVVQPCCRKYISRGRLLEVEPHSTSSSLTMLHQLKIRSIMFLLLLPYFPTIMDSTSGTVSQNKLPCFRSWYFIRATEKLI